MIATRVVRVFIFIFGILAVANALMLPSKTTVTVPAPTPTAPSQCNTGALTRLRGSAMLLDIVVLI